VISARAEDLYGAFLDPIALVAWLPPAPMTGELRDFDARLGGGYAMSLHHPPGERAFRAKTSENTDTAIVRFVELTPPKRIVEAVRFVNSDPRSWAR
jgi:uncharacterized protein YndB with AHSA1/START domain